MAVVKGLICLHLADRLTSFRHVADWMLFEAVLTCLHNIESLCLDWASQQSTPEACVYMLACTVQNASICINWVIMQQTLGLQAVVPAISDWLVVMEEADIVLMEEADIAWIPKSPKRDPMLLIPGLLKSNLTMEAMLHSLVCALTVYLDSQSKWHQLAQRGLEFLLSPLSASMRTASKQPAVQQSQDGAIVQLQYFDTLASASKFGPALLCICFAKPYIVSCLTSCFAPASVDSAVHVATTHAILFTICCFWEFCKDATTCHAN